METHLLMFYQMNLFLPDIGYPIFVPTQDMIIVRYVLMFGIIKVFMQIGVIHIIAEIDKIK